MLWGVGGAGENNISGFEGKLLHVKTNLDVRYFCVYDLFILLYFN